MIKIKKFINNLLLLCGIGVLVAIGWRLLELKVTGKINPNEVDSWVGLVLTWSLFSNLKSWEKEKKDKYVDREVQQHLKEIIDNVNGKGSVSK